MLHALTHAVAGLSPPWSHVYPASMYRLLYLALVLGPFTLLAQDDGPPIAITSPDTATTFAYGTVKNHSLVWSHQTFLARITFTDQELSETQPLEDIHEFRLPGITFDSATGVFYAKTTKGDLIPVAHWKKTLFVKSIETLPNARVRVIHPRGVVSVVLEAVSPSDPRMHPPKNDDPDATHKVDIDSILN